MFNKKTDAITLITSKQALYYHNSVVKLGYKIYLHYKDKSPKKGAKSLIESLLRGFKECHTKLIINPSNKKDITPYVYIPAVRSKKEITTLYKLKQQGLVKKVIAGPLGLIHPDSRNNLVEHDCIDHVVMASDWMAKYISSLNKDVKKKVVVIPAGVDMEYFKPTFKKTSPKVLLYTKNTSLYEDTKKQEEETISLLQELGISYKHIVYGQHKIEEYKKELSESDITIFINQSETQGIAFAESWSMDVACIVYNKSSNVAIVGNGIKRDINYYKTCPYIHKENGIMFNNSTELKTILEQYKNNKDSFLAQFKPRKWLEQNITDKAYAEKLIELFLK